MGAPACEFDVYKRLKKLQSEIEFMDIQEEYIKDEMKNLKREMVLFNFFNIKINLKISTKFI